LRTQKCQQTVGGLCSSSPIVKGNYSVGKETTNKSTPTQQLRPKRKEEMGGLKKNGKSARKRGRVFDKAKGCRGERGTKKTSPNGSGGGGEKKTASAGTEGGAEGVKTKRRTKQKSTLRATRGPENEKIVPLPNINRLRKLHTAPPEREREGGHGLRITKVR